MQTINVAVEGGDGVTYSLRTVDKCSTKILPLLIRKTDVANAL